MRRCSQKMSSESRVKLIDRYCYPMQYLGSGLFAIVRVDLASAKNGQADAVVISDSFAHEEDAWADALRRLEAR